MTLLDATPPKPPRKVGRYILIALAVIVVGGGRLHRFSQLS